MDTLSGGVTLLFSLLPPFLMGGSTLKGKNLLLGEQILSFQRRTHFRRVKPYRNINRKSKKLSVFLKLMEKIWKYTLMEACEIMFFPINECYQHVYFLGPGIS